MQDSPEHSEPLKARDRIQIIYIPACIRNVALYGLTESDGDLLGSIACDPLGSVRHKRIRKSLLYNGIDKLGRVNYAGIRNNGKSFFISHRIDEFEKIRILHFLGDPGKAEKTSVYRK